MIISNLKFGYNNNFSTLYDMASATFMAPGKPDSIRWILHINPNSFWMELFFYNS
jgi:hypothetical protein